MTPLLRAAKSGHEEVAKLLFEKGANPHPKDKHGHTPLSYAVCYRHEAVVKLLLGNGADPDYVIMGYREWGVPAPSKATMLTNRRPECRR